MCQSISGQKGLQEMEELGAARLHALSVGASVQHRDTLVLTEQQARCADRRACSHMLRLIAQPPLRQRAPRRLRKHRHHLVRKMHKLRT